MHSGISPFGIKRKSINDANAPADASCVGTTSCRTLESARAGTEWSARSGETGIFIYPAISSR